MVRARWISFGAEMALLTAVVMVSWIMLELPVYGIVGAITVTFFLICIYESRALKRSQ